MATTNKNFKVKNGLDVNGPIGVGTDPDYGIEGQILVSAGSNATPTWSDNSAESTFYLVRNNTGSTIVKGTLVSAYGAEPSGRIDVTPHETTGLQDSELRVMGVATANISNGVNGTVMSFGTLKNIDTRGNVASAIAVGDETWAEGDILYAHPTVAGKLTKVRPQHDLAVAFITVRHASSGQIAVRIIPGNHHLEWLHDVSIANTAADKDILQLNSSGIWVNANLATAGIANLSGATFTGNVAGTNLGLSGKNIFSNTGTGAPTFTTYSSGVRTVFYDNVGNTSVGYSRGIDAGVLWDSIPAADGGMYFKWYGGETQVASLSGTGVFTATTIVGNTNASTITTGTIDNARTTAASANGASTIVARDASGNFAANTITVTTLVGATNAATITGTVADATTGAVANQVGFLGIPRSSQNTTSTLALADMGDHLYVTASAQTITIPSNANVAFPIGAAITIIAAANTVSVAYQAEVTIYQAGVGLIASSPMTVGLYGMGTLLKVATDTWYISGVGVAD